MQASPTDAHTITATTIVTITAKAIASINHNSSSREAEKADIVAVLELMLHQQKRFERGTVTARVIPAAMAAAISVMRTLPL